MCMICEEQWSSEEMVVHAAIALDMQEVAKLSSGELASIKVGPSLTITVRKCPKCDIVTEKNGGCDHMRCARCSHEYYCCLLYTSPSPRDRQKSRMPSSA